MGRINDLKNFFSGKDKEKEKAEEEASKNGNKVKVVATKAIILGTIKFIASISIFVLVGAGVAALINAALDMITATNTPKRIYEGFELENEDFSELVEIKGNESTRLLFTI